MPETPLYIPATDGALFGVLHEPDPPGPARAAALLLGPGLDEKRAAYGTLARLARTLAAGGCRALRFDCRGTGDSAGDSVETSLSSMERDAADAAAFLRARAGDGAPLALVGFRLGASLALRLGAALGAARVAAVAPVAGGSGWLRQERGRSALRRSMIARELAAAAATSGAGALSSPSTGEPAAALPDGAAEDLGGLAVGARLVEELSALDLSAGSPAADGPETLIVQVSPRRSPLPEVARLADRFRARVECLNIEPFWQPLENPDPGPLAELLRTFVCGG